MTDILFLSDDERALVHHMMRKGAVTVGEAAALLGLEDEAEAVEMLTRLVSGGYVRTDGRDQPRYAAALASRPGRQLSPGIWQVLYEEVGDLFDGEGEKLTVGGNRPLLLRDAGSVWLVRAGAVHLFEVEATTRGASGARRFLSTVEPGAALFGLGAGDAPVDFIALGMPGTVLRRLPVGRLLELTADARHGRQVAALIDTWVRRLEQVALREFPPRDYVDLGGEGAVDLPAGRAARPRSEVRWVSLERGRARVAGLGADLQPGAAGAVPVSERNWITASEDTRLHTLDTPSWLAAASDLGDLGRYHAAVLQAAGAARAAGVQRERRRMEERARGDARALGGAVSRLAAVLDPSELLALGAEPEADPLLSAFRLVQHALGLQPLVAPRAEPAAASDERLRQLGAAARVRVRPVRLRSGWWQEDGGPLLGFRADGRPVALLPDSGLRYHMVDPVERQRVPVTAEVAARISLDAATITRAFPDRALGALDLVRFALLATRRDVATILGTGAAMGLLALLTPILTGSIFNRIIPGQERGTLLDVVIGLGAAGFASALFQLARGIALARLEGRMDGTVQSAVWDRLLELPVPFFSQYTAGDLVNRSMGINQMRQVLTGSVLNAVLSGIFSLFSFALLFYYSMHLALAATALVVLLSSVTLWANVRLVGQQRRALSVQGRLAGMVLQFITGVAKLRVSGAEARAFARWADLHASYQRVMIQAGGTQNALTTVSAVFPVVSSLVIFAVVGLSHGSLISAGAFLAFTSAYGQFSSSALGLSGAAMSLLQVVPLYERVRPILQTVPEADAGKMDPGELSGRIEVSRVTYRYAEDGPAVLQDVSIEARPGEFVALVGPSGSGKSTLMRLLLNFDTPEAGAVYLDGKDLRNLDARAVRRQIGVVLQTSRLMPGDIFSNIVGASSLTLEDAWEAARMAGFEEDVQRMPMGMHTYLSVGGGTLSGGQRQRLMIARALVKKPRILLFDEATSALDNRTQAIISRSLEELRATRIVIAHRLSTIINADRIYVLQGGRVLQTGMYEELAGQPGPFAELIRRQLA